MANRMHLNAFLMGIGFFEAAWRHPRTRPERITDVRFYQELARTAERGRLDSLFIADGLASGLNVQHNTTAVFEPLTLLSALAAATSRVGLIGTASTTYSDPFNLARAFASLDHISSGRAAWNIVTTAGERDAQNFGLDAIPPHAERYRRADEFVDVTIKLWDSWEDDALRFDAAAQVFADPAKVHDINHRGERFKVRGPLNSPRSPQGRPLLVQAGSSDDGMNFAARYAEAVFTAQQTVDGAQAFYRDLKRRVAAAGRAPELVKILPGFCPVVGGTEEEARRLQDELDSLMIVEYSLARLSGLFRVDLSAYPLDGPLPELPGQDRIQTNKSRFQLFVDLARRENLTIRQTLVRLSRGNGHRVRAGTPEQIADEMEHWFRSGAADGFNVIPPFLPGGLEDFVDHVVPVLQRRGLFRVEYTGSTLRDHYGVPRPASRYAPVPG